MHHCVVAEKCLAFVVSDRPLTIHTHTQGQIKNLSLNCLIWAVLRVVSLLQETEFFLVLRFMTFYPIQFPSYGEAWGEYVYSLQMS